MGSMMENFEKYKSLILKVLIPLFIGAIPACKTVNLFTIEPDIVNKYEIKDCRVDFTFWNFPKWVQDSLICFVGSKYGDVRHHVYVYNMQSGTLKELLFLPTNETIVSYWVSPDFKKLIYSVIEVPAFLIDSAMYHAIYDSTELELWFNRVRAKVVSPVTYCKVIDCDSLYVFWWHPNETLSKIYVLDSNRFIIETAMLDFEYSIDTVIDTVIFKNGNGNVRHFTVITHTFELITMPGKIYLRDDDTLVELATGSLLRSIGGDSLIYYITTDGDTQLFTMNFLTGEKMLIKPHLHMPPYLLLKSSTAGFADYFTHTDVIKTVKPLIIPTDWVMEPHIFAYIDSIGIVLYNSNTREKLRFTPKYASLIYAISPDHTKIAFFRLKKKHTSPILLEIYVYDWRNEIEKLLETIR